MPREIVSAKSLVLKHTLHLLGFGALGLTLIFPYVVLEYHVARRLWSSVEIVLQEFQALSTQGVALKYPMRPVE